MSDTPKRPSRPAAPATPDYADDATGLRSMQVDADAQDDLNALAASLHSTGSAPRAPARLPKVRPPNDSIRATIIPPLLTGGLICIGLAIAWFCTDSDSPYRRTGLVLPMVLAVAGLLLLAAAAFNMSRARRS